MKQIAATVGIVALLAGARVVIGQDSKEHGLVQPPEVKWGAAPASVSSGCRGGG